MIEYAKIREVKSPSRGTSRSAGIDFFVPTFNDSFIKDLEKNNSDYYGIVGKQIVLFAHRLILIPSGIKVKIPDGYFLHAHNKSGIASKKYLTKMAETIDEDYQGEVFFSILNTSPSAQRIDEGEKIIQLVLLEFNPVELVEKEISELYATMTERGEGCLGSTNK
jgi:dUTP pyrophosphatase